jgi:hypothetical protein
MQDRHRVVLLLVNGNLTRKYHYFYLNGLEGALFTSVRNAHFAIK